MTMPEKFPTLYISLVGSHAWGMQTPTSDLDFYATYLAPTRSILCGHRHDGGRCTSVSTPVRYDFQSFEIGHHVRQLMKCNLNHVLMVWSPSVDKTPDYHIIGDPPIKTVLKNIMVSNPSKAIYHSINGMALSNLEKYFDKGRASFLPIEETFLRMRKKKLGQILRILRFGMKVLESNEYELSPVQLVNGDYDDEIFVRKALDELRWSYTNSDYPDIPDVKPYEDFLVNIRRANDGEGEA